MAVLEVSISASIVLENVLMKHYTNRIEGQHTRPADIDRAIRKDFDADAAIAMKQRLAVAHIEVEEELEQGIAGANPVAPFSPVSAREPSCHYAS
jgi:hypothetical protein